jgi:hypothetical protein
VSRVELAHRFALPLRDGFDYIVDPRNWPEYWPGLVRVEPGSRWQMPGDRARVVMRLPGRSVELEMTLRTFDPYRLAVEFDPRAGVRGVVDRRLVRRGFISSRSSASTM